MILVSYSDIKGGGRDAFLQVMLGLSSLELIERTAPSVSLLTLTVLNSSLVSDLQRWREMLERQTGLLLAELQSRQSYPELSCFRSPSYVIPSSGKCPLCWCVWAVYENRIPSRFVSATRTLAISLLQLWNAWCTKLDFTLTGILFKAAHTVWFKCFKGFIFLPPWFSSSSQKEFDLCEIKNGTLLQLTWELTLRPRNTINAIY